MVVVKVVDCIVRCIVEYTSSGKCCTSTEIICTAAVAYGGGEDGCKESRHYIPSYKLPVYLSVCIVSCFICNHLLPSKQPCKVEFLKLIRENSGTFFHAIIGPACPSSPPCLDSEYKRVLATCSWYQEERY